MKNLILERWQAVLAERGGQFAILAADGTAVRSFAGIELSSLEVAAKLGGVPAGSVVSLQAGNVPAWPELLLGIWRSGCRVLLLDRSLSESARDAAERACGAVMRLTEEDVLPLWNEPRDLAGVDPHLIKLTSGTTGEPRAILFRAEQLVTDCDSISETMGIVAGDMNYGVVAFSHSYGFSNLVTPLLCRGVPLVASGDALPRAILAGLAATSATVLPAVPAIFQALSETEGELAQVRLCISAGAMLQPTTAAAFRSRFGRKIHTFYGASECGGIAYDASDSDVTAPGHVGTALRGVEIMPEPDGGIVVRSAAVGLGSSPSDEEVLGSGWFRPADLLERCGAGWRITGRRTDTINVAGRKVNPVEVETVLLAHPAVREAAVFGAPDEGGRGEAVVAWMVPHGTVVTDDILRHCRERLAAWQVPREICTVAAIPLNGRGKVSRRDLARLHLGG